jgi:hypothetical protein
VTWVLSGDEHVAAYIPPANVVSVDPGRSLEEMLRAGDLAAVIGADLDAPDIAPLIPAAADAGLQALHRRGFYPINHLVVVKDEVLDAHPDLAAGIFDAFARAKQVYVDKLREGAIEAPTKADRMYRRVLELTGDDPLPYGIEPNRAILTELMAHAVSQRILDRPMALDALFAPGTLDLSG